MCKKPKGWVRVYADESEESEEAIELLCQACYQVITFPVKGKFGPEAQFKRKSYFGLDEIKKLLT